MALPRFFLETQVLAEEDQSVFPLRLSSEDAAHARVLRLRPGEHIAVIDASQDYFECEIVSFDDSIPLVRITARQSDVAEGPLVMVVQGLAKGDKMDQVIRQGTELGVAAFVPMICHRSVVRLDGAKQQAKMRRWQAVAKSAAMQSGRNAIPEVSEPQTVSDLCQRLSSCTAVLVCWEEAAEVPPIRESLIDALEQCFSPRVDARIAVVVGPEGGLEQDEVDRLLQCNPRSALMSLGPTILRTETAGVIAPALVLYELGGLGNKVIPQGRWL